ncbi:MAG: hypothetical protein IT429_19925 [Gemmataceae bacterium]|nr:hypothetical protein [Gemmataceae bacterium]
MSEKLRVPWKASVVAAAGLSLAGAAGVECGGGGSEPEVLGAATVATESFTATVIPGQTKVVTAEQTSTSAVTPEVIVPITAQNEIKKEVTAVYKGKTLQNGSCSVDIVDNFIDQIYALYQKNPNKFTLAGGIASVYAELVVMSENSKDESVTGLMKRIEAGVSELTKEHLKERNLPAENLQAGIDAWNQSVARKVLAIKDGSGCDIVIEGKK